MGKEAARYSFLFLFVFAYVPAVAQMYGVLAGAKRAEPADDGGAVVIVDENDGSVIILGTPLPGVSLNGLAFDNLGRLFASTSDSTLIEIDPQTGALIRTVGTFTGEFVYETAVQDLAFDPVSGQMFAVSAFDAPYREDTLLVVDLINARVTPRGSIRQTDDAFTGIGFSSDGRLWGIPDHTPVLYEFDPENGALLQEIPLTGVTPELGSMAVGLRWTDDRLFFSNRLGGSGPLNDIYSTDLEGNSSYLGTAGGTRRVHDFAWFVPASEPMLPGPPGAGRIDDVPGPGRWVLAVLALLVAAFGIRKLALREI